MFSLLGTIELISRRYLTEKSGFFFPLAPVFNIMTDYILSKKNCFFFFHFLDGNLLPIHTLHVFLPDIIQLQLFFNFIQHLSLSHRAGKLLCAVEEENYCFFLKCKTSIMGGLFKPLLPPSLQSTVKVLL